MLIYYVMEDGSLLKPGEAIMRADGLWATAEGRLVARHGFSPVTKRADLSDEQYEAQKPSAQKSEPDPDPDPEEVKDVKNVKDFKPGKQSGSYKTRQSKAD